jgi:hypothetical protein
MGADNMIVMSVTDFSRRMKDVLNQVEFQGEEVVLVRNNKKLAKLIPQSSGGTALEVMADLYATLPEIAADAWLEDSRGRNNAGEIRDPWAT